MRRKTLPNSEEPEQKSMPETRVVRILHISNHKADVVLCRDLLKRAGFKVDACWIQDRQHFLKAIKQATFDLIVSDYVLPGFDGMSALGLAREYVPNVPFLFYASSHGEEAAVMALKRGAVDYVLRESSGRYAAAVCEALHEGEQARMDMAAREQAEKARSWLAAIVQSSDNAIISKNLDGIITSWNLGAERLFGYTASEAVGKPITVLVPPDRLGEERDILEKLRRGESIQHFETERMTKHGKRLFLSLSVSPIRDVSGRVVGASKIAHDITEQKNAESILHRIQQQYTQDLQKVVTERTTRLEGTIKSLAGVCYHIAHDLRAPVRAVRGFSEMLRDTHERGLDPTGKDYLRRILQSCDRMEVLIQDLLAYGRLSHTDLAMTWVELDPIVTQLLENVATEIQARKAVIEVARPLPKIWANATVLEQVMGNLLSNALKYVGRNVAPHVRVWAEETETSVRVYVEDNGIGIPQVHQQRIFQIFERLHPESDYTGTGIGLAIVQKGVERLNGRVSVDSEVGRGSRFCVELPRPKPEVTPFVRIAA